MLWWKNSSQLFTHLPKVHFNSHSRRASSQLSYLLWLAHARVSPLFFYIIKNYGRRGGKKRKRRFLTLSRSHSLAREKATSLPVCVLLLWPLESLFTRLDSHIGYKSIYSAWNPVLENPLISRHFSPLGGRCSRAHTFSHSILFAVCVFLLVPSGISGALMFVAVIKFHQSHIFNKPRTAALISSCRQKFRFPKPLNGNQFWRERVVVVVRRARRLLAVWL